MRETDKNYPDDQQDIIDALRAGLAAVTAERDALRAHWEVNLVDLLPSDGSGVSVAYYTDTNKGGGSFAVSFFFPLMWRDGKGATLQDAIENAWDSKAHYVAR